MSDKIARDAALVNRIIPFSCVDGPGNRTAVFLQGCGFDCRYCHNPETIGACVHCGECVAVCPTGALTADGGTVRYDIAKCVMCDACIKVCPHSACPRTRALTPDQVMREVAKNIPFIRGVTVSGGECTRWRDFLVGFLGLAKERRLNTLLDSNGSYDFSSDLQLMAVTDGVMLDVKAWDAAEHLRLTGQDNELVKRNLRWLAAQGKLQEVRTVIVPELFDYEDTVRQVCRVLQETGRLETRYKIICYRPVGVRKSEQDRLKAPSQDMLDALAALAREHGLSDVVII